MSFFVAVAAGLELDEDDFAAGAAATGPTIPRTIAAADTDMNARFNYNPFWRIGFAFETYFQARRFAYFKVAANSDLACAAYAVFP